MLLKIIFYLESVVEIVQKVLRISIRKKRKAERQKRKSWRQRNWRNFMFFFEQVVRYVCELSQWSGKSYHKMHIYHVSRSLTHKVDPEA